jgi:hypothetical protein
MARRAYSLDTLVAQVNSAYPNRNKASDGWLGDEAHQATASDHNANAQGVVCAQDLTNDPAHGFDAHATADRLRTNRHPDLKYLISNRRIAQAPNWNWEYYGGSNPHDKHIHISVGVGPDGQSRQPYDDRVNWNIKGVDNVNGTPNDGDIVNAKRASTGVPDYQPTGPELDYFKQPEHGFKALMYDTMAGMQAQIDNLKANPPGFTKVGIIDGIGDIFKKGTV